MAYLGRKGALAGLTSSDIPDNSITSAKIVDGAVAVADLGPNSVDSSELVDGSIDTSHIADDQVTGDKLANDIAISTTGAITTTGAFTSVGIDDNASGAVAITIDSDENIGIKTNSPSSADSNARNLVISSATPGITIRDSAATDGSSYIKFADSAAWGQGAIQYWHGGDAMLFYTNGANERMRITSSGRVGIGSTPYNSGYPQLTVTESDSGEDPTNPHVYGLFVENNYSGNDNAVFQTASGPGKTVTITSAGRVGIGVTSPGALLHVKGDVPGGYGCYFLNDGGNSTRYGIELNCGANDASGTNYAVRWNDGNGTDQGFVTFSGGTVSYGAFTAVHDVQLPDADNENGYPYGTLVETTEISYKRETERGIEYKVKKTSSAYSKAVLGAYSGKHELTAGDVDVRYKESDTIPEGQKVGDIKETVHEERFDNLHQVNVLGDGHILCNGEKGNISVGDGICTSSAEGQGMKADKMAMIIGIAQEDATFSGSESKLVAVQYGLQQFTPWT